MSYTRPPRGYNTNSDPYVPTVPGIMVYADLVSIFVVISFIYNISVVSYLIGSAIQFLLFILCLAAFCYSGQKALDILRIVISAPFWWFGEVSRRMEVRRKIQALSIPPVRRSRGRHNVRRLRGRYRDRSRA